MKMSDVFNLPLFAKNHDVGVRCSIYEGRGVTVASSFYANQLKAYEAMCAAVNNHDKLVEFVKQCASFHDTQDAFDSCALNGIAINAKALLDELNPKNTEQDLPITETKIESLRDKFSPRLYNALVASDIKTIGDIIDIGEVGVKKMQNIGRKSFLELCDFLYCNGIKLRKC